LLQSSIYLAIAVANESISGLTGLPLSKAIPRNRVVTYQTK
jgi:hypothetical protein